MRSDPATGCRVFELWRVGTLALHRPAGRIHQHFAITGSAVQLVFVGALDTQFADQRGAGVGRRIDARQILLADGGDIAQRVHRDGSEGVVPRKPGADVHAGELVAMHRKAGHFLIIEGQLDGDAFIDVVRQDGAFEAAHIVRIEQSDGHQARQGRVEFRHPADLLSHQLELKRRQIVSEHHAMAVENQTAAGGDRVGMHSIALRQLGIVSVLDDLQIKEPPGNGQQQHGDDHARDDAANREDALLGPVILDSHTTRQFTDPSL